MRQRFAHAYRTTAIIILNIVVAFVAVNVLLGLGLVARASLAALGRPAAPPGAFFEPDGRPIDNGRRTRNALATFDYTACPEVEPAFAAEVLDDFFALAQRGFAYQPWVQFAEPPFRGGHVSVRADELGVPMRGTSNPSRDGDTIRIYAFGGSTTFGYNVADEHTWPSFLSRILNDRAGDPPVEVRNYGRGFYYPSQEVALLIDLLRSGHRPSLVVFLDGLNVGHTQDVPHFSADVEQAMHQRQHERGDRATLKALQLRWLPAWRVLRRILQRVADPQRPAAASSPEARRRLADILAQRFEENRRLARRVAALYGVPTLHVIQPNALVNYPVELYRTLRTERFLRARELARAIYAHLRARPGYVDLGDLFRDWGHRKAVLDTTHYTPAFNEFLARRISQHIRLEALTATPTALDPSQLTGESRAGGAPTQSPLL